MIFGENDYAVDDEGNRVLLGLTADETREFLELTDGLSSASPGRPLSFFDCTSPVEMRWLELMEKHAAELSKCLLAPKRKH
jgi:hypothetical protein